MPAVEDHALEFMLCDAVAAALLASPVLPGGCSVEVRELPDFSLPELRTGRILVCPSQVSDGEITRGGAASRQVEIEIGFLIAATEKEVRRHSLNLQKIARFFEYKAIPGGRFGHCFAAERTLLYDPEFLRTDGVFRGVITLSIIYEES